ncbi:MAG: hypothetical protein H0U74_09830 [Bradymonadaceae bacterium]|nr:hypothetical protein [Lujinxingiaceae bacterium]
MDTRRILQIVLGFIVVLVVVMGAVTVYQVTREAETIIVKKVTRASDEKAEVVNPWSDKGDAAIALVKRVRVAQPAPTPTKKGAAAEEAPANVGDMLESEEFIRSKLKIASATNLGWQATWWGETQYGPSYFLVRFAFQDENITVGPAWLVDIRSQKVIPKNVLAQVVEDPQQGVNSDYYDKAQQVVSAITNHRFESKMNLAGALLLYFEQRDEVAESDTILGWTIDHDRGNLFKAYFQWVENNERTYAEFDFDFDAKALKSVNLQAAQIMRVGEEFEVDSRVSIMPGTYNPSEPRAANRWTGAARQQCQRPQHRDGCKALSMLLDQSELIETLEWLLTARANTAEDFEACKQARKCHWSPGTEENGIVRVNYSFNLGESAQTITWEVSLQKGSVEPVDRVSQLAFRAIHPRS